MLWQDRRKIMEKVLVLNDGEGEVSEYEICYDQNYMNICLEEYRKKYSLLIKKKIVTNGSTLTSDESDSISHFDDVVGYSVVGSNADSKMLITIIGAINPAVYNILSDGNGEFSINSAKIASLMAWYTAILSNSVEKSKYNSKISGINDYFNMREKSHMPDGISDLLSGVSLRYIGPGKNNKKNYNRAVTNSVFVSEFGIRLERGKKYVKEKGLF